MAIPPRQIDERAARQSGLRVIGVVLVLLGIAAAVYGFSQLGGSPALPSDWNAQMTDAANDGTNFTTLFLIGIACVAVLAGFGCLSASFSTKDVTAPGSTGLTCRACGLLNEPGARTCETCGEPLSV